MSVTMAIMLSSGARTNVGPKTMAKFFKSILLTSDLAMTLVKWWHKWRNVSKLTSGKACNNLRMALKRTLESSICCKENELVTKKPRD